MNRNNSNYRNKPTPVQFMSTRERENLHRLGVWVDKWGNHVPVHDMNAERLEKLVKMLAEWAMQEDDPILWLRVHPIFYAVWLAVIEKELTSYHASMFRLAAIVDYEFENH